MNNLNVVRQTAVEQKMLAFLIEGLHNTLAWKVQGDDLSRKVSTLKFITRSFQSHMERLMSLEERDGYMDMVLETHPHLSKTVEALRKEHEEMRKGLKHVSEGFESVSAKNRAAIADLCGELTTLLKTVADHTKKESDLLQDAFEQEEGGEG